MYVSRPLAVDTGQACRHIFGQNVQSSSWRATLCSENGSPGSDMLAVCRSLLAHSPALYDSCRARSVQVDDALAERCEVARDPRIVGLEHGEPLEHVERARQIAVAAVDPGQVDEHARDDLPLRRRGDPA